MPWPLLVSAAIRPDTRVPCQELLPMSSDVQVLPSAPESMSAWLTQSPGSLASLSAPLPSLAAAIWVEVAVPPWL